jgi:hypothetical protein
MRRTNWKVREAVSKDFKSLPVITTSISMRAWVLEVEDKLVGVGGVFLRKGAWTAFVRVIDNTLASKRILTQAMKIGFDKILAMNLPTLCAIKEKELETADRLLDYFNFSHVCTIGNEEVYVWDQR